MRAKWLYATACRICGRGIVMTRQEWIDIGYEKNIIELEDYEQIKFKDVYQQWFLMKLRCIKSQSCDRIECTYNRYYSGSPFVEKCVSNITETDILDFLNKCILTGGNMTYKGFGRVLQIVNNVLVYAKDLKIGGACLYDWDKIKRYLPLDALENNMGKEYAVSPANVEKIIDLVVNHKIYHIKQSACLCLCMNFYLGLRIGELASLTFRDFDFERNVVKIFKTESKFYNRSEDGSRIGTMVYRVVEDTKTVYSVREIPILPEVKFIYEKIKEHHAQNKYESPFLAYDGKDTILVRSLDRTLRKLCLLCDIDYFNSHEIRKTFATMLHFGGVPTRVISDLMGHSEIGTTENSYILSYANNYDKMYDFMKNALTYGEGIRCPDRVLDARAFLCGSHANSSVVHVTDAVGSSCHGHQ